jgi:hypothetical protein
MLIAAKGYVFLFNDIVMFFNGYDAPNKERSGYLFPII